MRASDHEKALADEIWSLFHRQQYDRARAKLDSALKDSDHPRFRRIDARFLVFEGCEQQAADILKDIIEHVWQPGSWELALAGNGAGRAKKLDDAGILFFPIRKCGSTSVLNILKHVAGEEMRGEDIHEEDHHNVPVRFAALKTKYADYFSCALVRGPAARVNSYFHGNIVARNHLANHHEGADEFYGLPTRPSWDFFLRNLTRYRQVFVTARNHTEPVSRFLGTDPDLFSWVGGMANLPELVSLIAARTGLDLPVLKEMATPGKPDHQDQALPDDLAAFYSDDLRHYGQYF